MRLKNWFKNAELRTVILHDGACVGRPAAQDFIPELATATADPRGCCACTQALSCVQCVRLVKS